MAHLPLHCCGFRRAWGHELLRNTQAMVPEPNDAPKPDNEPDDEPDEEPDDEPDEEPDDEPDEERDDEPEPGTLYFGGGRRMDGPILLKPDITPQPPGGADTASPAGSISPSQGQCPKTAPLGPVMCWGVESVSLGKPLH
jgi:outer membrane biosynthesis protein TonB